MSLLSGLKLNAHQQMLASLPSDLPDSFFCGPSDENGTALCSDSVVPGPGVRILVIGEAVSTLRKPAQLEPISTAIGSLSSDVVEPFQDTLKTGVSTPVLGAASLSRVVGNGASVDSSALDGTGRVVKPVCAPRNSATWRQVGDFLNAQWLASLGLSRVRRADCAAGDSAAAAALPAQSAPVGNHGDNVSFEVATA